MPLQFCDQAPSKIVAATVVCAATSPKGLNGGAADKIPPLNVVEIRDPDGQILSFRHLAGSTEVVLRGTRLAQDAQVRLKVGSRPGFVELDINRGGITGLRQAHTLGRDFLTYVLWAVSVDGRASNLGEITFDSNDRAVAINVTTPYQTFWLMVTAEPNYAVVDPSPQVVLYSVKQAASVENKAMPIGTHLFFFTHYAAYSGEAGGPAGVPNQLLQARKAVELARKAAAATKGRSGRGGLQEEEFTSRSLSEATSFLVRAEQAFKSNPRGQDFFQYARTAAQSAENARSLAMGAVGGLVIRQLQDEVDRLQQELSRLRQPGGAGSIDSLPLMPTDPPVATAAPVGVIDVPLAKQPAIWFAVAGWLLAIIVLFRRRPA